MCHSIPGVSEDMCLQTEVVERMTNFDPAVLITREKLSSRLGISEAKLTGFEDV